MEKDGDLGDNTGPTSQEENVYVGNVLEPGVIVNLNACYRCTCGEDLQLHCSAHNQTWMSQDDVCIRYHCVDGSVTAENQRLSCTCGPDEEMVQDYDTDTPLCCSCQQKPKPATTAAPPTTVYPPFTSPTPEFRRPPVPCSLFNVSGPMAFETSDGDTCRLPSDVTLALCRGACDGFDGLRFRPVAGEAVRPTPLHNSQCSCCTGFGDWVTQSVVCDRAGSTSVELYVYTSCACTACQSSGETGRPLVYPTTVTI